MKYQTFAKTTLEGGASHQKQNKPCQDRSKHFSEDGIYIAVVSDGHGSDNCFRSEKGAEFAVEAATDGIRDFIKNLHSKELPLEENFARQVKKLVGTIVDNWIFRVSEHYHNDPITEEEMSHFQVDSTYRDLYLKEASGGSSGGGGFLDETERPVTRHAYGATLVAAAVTEDYWFGLQIGDGKLTAFYPDGSYDQPVPWDDKCYLNVTTSICDDDAAERARIYVKKLDGTAASIDAVGKVKRLEDNRPMPLAVFVNSDGVDDSFHIDDNMNHMATKFYYPVFRMFIENEADPTKGWKAAVQELADYLPNLSKRGSGDDISVAGIVDMEAVKAVPFSDALQKAKVEAEERRAKEQAEKAEREEAAKVAEEALKAEEETAEKLAKKKETAEKKETEAAKTKGHTGTQKTTKPSTTPRHTKSTNPRQTAHDPKDKATAIKHKAQQEAKENAAQITAETRQKAKEAKSRIQLEDAFQSHYRNTQKEADIDIPASDAKKVQLPPQPGTNIDTKA